jgi:hypothetical protein
MAGEPDHDRTGQAEHDHDPVRDEHRPHPVGFATASANPAVTDAPGIVAEAPPQSTIGVLGLPGAQRG